jgi:hypothetical protein
MKKLIAVTTATLIVAGMTTAPAFAKHRKHHSRHYMSSEMPSSARSGGTVGMTRGNNAELMGNNGNSAQGSNSLGHIQGGNIGGGK